MTLKTSKNCMKKIQRRSKLEKALGQVQCGCQGNVFISIISRLNLGRVRLGSIWNKNNWNNAFVLELFSFGIPGFPFRLFCSNIFRNIFRNIFLFRNILNERALSLQRRCSLGSSRDSASRGLCKSPKSVCVGGKLDQD